MKSGAGSPGRSCFIFSSRPCRQPFDASDRRDEPRSGAAQVEQAYAAAGGAQTPAGPVDQAELLTHCA